MKNIFCALILTIMSYQAYARSVYQVDESVSTVSFATVKKQYVVEPAVISNITGSLDDSGNFKATVPLKHLKTGIPIRDERINELFFNFERFPAVQVQGQIPTELLQSDKVVSQHNIPLSVTLFGTTQTLDFHVNVVKTGDIISVSSTQPTTINSNRFNIPHDNLQKLAKTVGGIGISNAAPVTVSLVLKK